MRSGDFSTDTNILYDPATAVVGPTGTITKTPFASNIIPSNRIDKIAQAIIPFYPLPDLPGITRNYTLVSETSTKQIRTYTRIYFNPTTTDTISGRFSYTDP